MKRLSFVCIFLVLASTDLEARGLPAQVCTLSLSALMVCAVGGCGSPQKVIDGSQYTIEGGIRTAVGMNIESYLREHLHERDFASSTYQRIFHIDFDGNDFGMRQHLRIDPMDEKILIYALSGGQSSVEWPNLEQDPFRFRRGNWTHGQVGSLYFRHSGGESALRLVESLMSEQDIQSTFFVVSAGSHGSSSAALFVEGLQSLNKEVEVIVLGDAINWPFVLPVRSFPAGDESLRLNFYQRGWSVISGATISGFYNIRVRNRGHFSLSQVGSETDREIRSLRVSQGRPQYHDQIGLDSDRRPRDILQKLSSPQLEDQLEGIRVVQSQPHADRLFYIGELLKHSDPERRLNAIVLARHLGYIENSTLVRLSKWALLQTVLEPEKMNLWAYQRGLPDTDLYGYILGIVATNQIQMIEFLNYLVELRVLNRIQLRAIVSYAHRGSIHARIRPLTLNSETRLALATLIQSLQEIEAEHPRILFESHRNEFEKFLKSLSEERTGSSAAHERGPEIRPRDLAGRSLEGEQQ